MTQSERGPAAFSRPSGAVSIIATTSPDEFAMYFGDVAGRSVLILDSGADVLDALERHSVRVLVADFRELSDRWTGQRFVRHVRASPHLDHVDVWMMADSWRDFQNDWCVKLGGRGYLRRDPSFVAAALGYAQPAPAAAFTVSSASAPAPSQAGAMRRAGPATSRLAHDSMPAGDGLLLDDWLDQADEIFAEFAGPMRRMLIEDAREEMSPVVTGTSLRDYTDRLAQGLQMYDRRRQFLTAVAPLLTSYTLSFRRSN